MGYAKILTLSTFLVLGTANFSFPSERFAAAGVENDQEVIVYFNKIKKQIISNDKFNLGLEINFPIYVYINNVKEKIIDRRNFINNYDDIFNNDLKASISNQTHEELFANWQGVSTGGGEIWFSLVKGKDSDEWIFKIIAINNK